MTEQTTTTEQTTPDATEEAPVVTTPAPAGYQQKAKNKLGNCECAAWEIGKDVEGEGDEVDITIETTGCDKQTKRLFAQGHDAKLKSLFIRAGVEGLDVRWGRDGGTVHTMDAETAAARFGFGEQVQKAILSRLDKLARGKKAIPAAPKQVAVEVAEGSEEGDLPAIPEAPAEQDGWTDEATEAVDELLAPTTDEPKVQGKIGRWTYEGIVAADGAFIYTGGSGEQKVAEAGKWSPVAL